MHKITFHCPACDLPLTVPASAASATGPCPACGEIITGPGLEEDVDPDSGIAEETAADSGLEEEAAADLVSEEDSGLEELPETAPGGDPAPVGPFPDPFSDPFPGGGPSDRLDPPVARSGVRLGLGAVAGLCILCGVACLALGYQLGRSADRPSPAGEVSAGAPAAPSPAPSAPVVSATPVEPVPVVTIPAPAPVPAPEPSPVVPSDPEVPDQGGPDTTALLGFLNARDWTTRNQHVLHAEQVRSRMEEFAATHGDGPIEFVEVTRMRHTEDASVFEVRTPGQPKGFPLALALVDGRWLVDWLGFADFHHGLFQAFATGDPKASGTFRLLVRPDLARAEDVGLQPYAASTTDPGTGVMIFAKLGSPVYQELEDLIGTLATKSPTSFRTLMENGGVPLILHLTKTDVDDRTVILIDRIVGQSWSPVPPEDS